jgi:hypothetical protein
MPAPVGFDFVQLSILGGGRQLGKALTPATSLSIARIVRRFAGCDLPG